MLTNLWDTQLPRELIEQHLPVTASLMRQRMVNYSAQAILIESVSAVLRRYRKACEPV
jgi:tagatose-1,6-bisphosphate aldolase non-catalytic subunit AgaZ/GatZ